MTRELETTIRGDRLHLDIQGIVQGVGFRPFVYQLATALNIAGWVTNTADGVVIEIEGDRPQLEQFCQRLLAELPPHAQIHRLHRQEIPPQGQTDFLIQASESHPQRKTALILPDLATCSHCIEELFNPNNRRYRYPFINCTHCGPRYSIIETLPYDRPLTTMAGFPLCNDCQQEYDNPGDRRFHAQPNACEVCGPQLTFHPATNLPPLDAAQTLLRQGQILALKGLGGVQLLVNAQDEVAVQRLRQRKHRPSKPFAVMYPHLDVVRQDCSLSDSEAELLQSPAAPIVLLRQLLQHQQQPRLAPSVAPNNPDLGVMLPYTPLHHLLLREFAAPLIATSGNLSGEPICIDNQETLQRLGNIADGFLLHNRPIARPVDDSVVRVMAKTPVILRRARGYAPRTLSLPGLSQSVLAVGGYFKNTVAIAFDEKVFVSQHIGDLDNPASRQAFDYTLAKLSSIYDFEPEVIVCDSHPDYPSTQFAQHLAQDKQCSLIRVQHHQAHILSVMAEHGLQAPVLGIAWDGTGYGMDGTIWGGELLQIDTSPQGFQRLAHCRSFPLLGGDRAAKEPRRAALGLLWEAFGEEMFQNPALTSLPPLRAFSPSELNLVQTALRRGLNTPRSSSVGRLFDAIASLLGLQQRLSFEGEAAMALEFAARTVNTGEVYPISLSGGVWDWQEMLLGILGDRTSGESIPYIAAKFHNSLIEAIAQMLQTYHHPSLPVVLTGGCFGNQRLLEGAIARLQQMGIQPYINQQFPANDGGLSLGQIYRLCQS
ncbi:MAG: carbamoyltransferase HypF [Sodalinema sp.]|uniref:carbamoyltransferase HypF n=1 Tax=Sodalinema sp. TaxID=3080550 RepID=UPI00396F4916